MRSLKTSAAIVALALLTCSATHQSVSFAQATGVLVDGTRLPFYIFHEAKSRDNHYIPSGWMGDYGDLSFNDHWKKQPKDNHSVIRISYSAKAKQNVGWAGIYWQHPANNWGGSDGGFNLNGAQRLVFMARGEKGRETIDQFKVGGIEGTFRDSATAAIGPIQLKTSWKEYTIPLTGQELSSIAGGFCLTLNRTDNPDGAVVYLDNIRFE